MNTKLRTSVAAPRTGAAAMLLLAVGALAGLAACGQKGPLYLPTDKPAAAAPAAPASAPASTPATSTGAPR